MFFNNNKYVGMLREYIVVYYAEHFIFITHNSKFGNSYTYHKVTLLKLRIMCDKYKVKLLLEQMRLVIMLKGEELTCREIKSYMTLSTEAE